MGWAVDVRQARSGAVAVTLGALAGAGAALANFVMPGPAAGIGAVAGVVTFYGGHRWEQHQERRRVREAWQAAVLAGPSARTESAVFAGGDSVLEALNPDHAVVPFSPLRGAELRQLLRWCATASERRVWPVSGDAGGGKTRLLLEVSHRLSGKGWECGWIRHGRATDAISAAALRDEPVLLIVDDADAYSDQADLERMLTGVARLEAGSLVRVALSAREFGAWWEQLLSDLEPAVHAALTPAGHTRLSPIVIGGVAGQQQLFAQAVTRYARHFSRPAPVATLAGVTAATSLAELHAAAAITAHDGLTGTVAVDTALQVLFATEEAWWQENASAWGLNCPLTDLQAALTMAALIGADDRHQMARRLRCLPSLSAASPKHLTDIALWLHQLYGQRADQWIDPHLPAHLAERYAGHCALAQPALPTALSAAALVV